MRSVLWSLVVGFGLLLCTSDVRAEQPARATTSGPTYDPASGGYYFHRTGEGWYYYRPGEGWYYNVPGRGWQMYERLSYYAAPADALSSTPTYSDYSYAQPRVRKFSQFSPYGGYSWRPLPFPEWDRLTLPYGD
jgi:hypothetical protein